ncbi:MAG TPA: hypothetical protein VFP68_06265, partial [Burkholderiaceae bacterium]|nr:hypothetical protein [Burkholderiaceae bacterium]
LVEFRRGREVELVQFGVKKTTRRMDRIAPVPPDVTNILRGGKLGIRDTVIEELERGFGSMAVSEGLERFERFLSGADRPRIGNAGAYLRTIIVNKAREEGGAGQGGSAAATADEVIEHKATPVPPTRREVEDAEWHRRFTLVREQFARLHPEEQAEWVRRVRDQAESSGATSRIVMKRLSSGEWQSPLVQAMVIQHYAKSEIDDDWATMGQDEFERLMGAPTEVDYDEA